ncbi:rhodanese-like domain-containing protein [Pelagibius sp. 7325]|uniref:rhodanese-like domain-containing protein n=1 Tax=Pelagibius sp. 7325 TaxID=3131994 RepID=UPI0030EB5DAC
MSRDVSAEEAKTLIHDGAEIAFLDLREAGEFGEGHPLFAIPCAYSSLEARITALAPRRSVRMLLIDGGDGVAARAAMALEALGYSDVMIVAGGTPAWRAAGYTLFQGVNVPSKTLGELAEHAWHPETIDAPTLKRWQGEGRAFRFFDARPPAEYAKMRVPGAVCLPNGELAHRFPAAVDGADTPVVVTCAGRTRGIVGVLGLRLAGIDQPVYALENGTQGWQLAGFTLERGNAAASYPALDGAAAEATRARADALIARHSIATVGVAEVAAWHADPARTTYLFDLRTPQETAADPAPAFLPALSGQLVQATDQWVGVRHARLVLLDDLGLRGAIAAFWLRQLGYEVAVARIDDGLRALAAPPAPPALPAVEEIPAVEALRAFREGEAQFVDLRGSSAYRAGHVAGAQWSIRPRLDRLFLGPAATVCLIGDDPAVTALAAGELRAPGFPPVREVRGGQPALVEAGAALEATPDTPSPAEAIDFLFFVHDRHDGNLESSRRYLAWEQGLIAQLDAAERAAFVLSDRGL